MKLLSTDAYNYNKGSNVQSHTNTNDGHYYALKNAYMSDTRKSTITSTYSRADLGVISAIDRNFQHDKTHHAFVSTVIYNASSLPQSKNYNSSTSTNKDGWIFDTSSVYEAASDTNKTYGTDINMSLGYATSTQLKAQLIDTSNNGDDFCGNYYGIGWRLPTAYEMGINTANATGTVGYVPAYRGNYTQVIGIISSTVETGTIANHWMLQDDNGKSYKLAKDSRYARCIYVP